MTTAPPVFTAELANRSLPLVRRIAQDIRTVFVELAELRPRPGEEAQARRKALENRLRDFAGELDQIGCQFKGFHDGHALIDFPGRLDGRPVCLCWRGDEAEVAYFHGLEEGFAGRRPLPAAAREA